MELSDKETFEVALIENVQHMTLQPIEEASAFKKYIEEYGWGGATELAGRINKSISYVSHRILLLTLPPDVIEKLCTRELNFAQARELLWIKDSEAQRKFARIASAYGLSSRELRGLIGKIDRSGVKDAQAWPDDVSFGMRQRVEKKLGFEISVLSKLIIVLRVAMSRIDRLIERVDGNNQLKSELLQKRLTIHSLIDDAVKTKLMKRNQVREISR
jgi:ParB family chromosome partitioning protein